MRYGFNLSFLMLLTTVCFSQRHTFLINIDSLAQQTGTNKAINSLVNDRQNILQDKLDEGIYSFQKKMQELQGICASQSQIRQIANRLLHEQDNLLNFKVFVEDTLKLYREAAHLELKKAIFDQTKQYLKEKNSADFTLLEIKNALYYNEDLDITADYLQWLKLNPISFDFLKTLDKKYKIREKSNVVFAKLSPYGIPFYIKGHPKDASSSSN